MKKLIMLISAMLPLLTAAAAVRYLPEFIPMHFDLDGKADRYGSKLELFIYPVVVIIMTAVFMLIYRGFERKAKNAPDEKARKGNENNAAIVSIMAVVNNAVQLVMEISMVVTAARGTEASGDILFNAEGICLGVMMVIIGNIMPRTRRNGTIGLRTKYSLSDDEVWAKSNRFAGRLMFAGGVLLVVLSFVLKGLWVIIGLLLMLIAISIAGAGYSRKLYLSKQNNEKSP